MNSIAAIIVAAGTGSRMGGTVPKQYRMLKGEPVIAWSLEAFAAHPHIDRILVVHHADHAEYIDSLRETYPHVEWVLGGAERQDSVRLGLNQLSVIRRQASVNRVLIHDAARPNLLQALITRMVETEALAALPVIPVTDTIKHKQGHTLDRTELFAAQTPQSFDFQTILKLHRENKEAVTDDVTLAEQAGIKVAFIEGDIANRKITTEEDLMQMSVPSIRVGNGYDVHGFIAHENDDHTIMICGVSVPCEMAIEGHSDGDVGLHALTDAILGTIGAEDIGHHFSSDKPEWKNAASELFLKEAMRLLKEAGGTLSHCDITLIAQMPKLSPHREVMRAQVANICEIDISQVSVKATTTDHLGFIGRKEGLAAQATATIILQ